MNFKDGKNNVIVNEAGDRTTPSVLAVNDNEIVIILFSSLVFISIFI
jgi:molecular chaperone DnaK (HSP70)